MLQVHSRSTWDSWKEASLVFWRYFSCELLIPEVFEHNSDLVCFFCSSALMTLSLFDPICSCNSEARRSCRLAGWCLISCTHAQVLWCDVMNVSSGGASLLKRFPQFKQVICFCFECPYAGTHCLPSSNIPVSPTNSAATHVHITRGDMLLLAGRLHICHPVARSQKAGLWLLQLNGQYAA